MGQRTAELLERHLFSRDRFHDIGTGNEHLRRALDHEHEIGNGRAVDRTAGTATHDHAYLGDHTGRGHVAPEYPAVIVQRHHALLDPGAAPIVDTDQRRSERCGQVDDLMDFSPETSPSVPPLTVKSCEKRQTFFPSTVPKPVTTPSV